jgi:hypothetical protein
MSYVISQLSLVILGNVLKDLDVTVSVTRERTTNAHADCAAGSLRLANNEVVSRGQKVIDSAKKHDQCAKNSFM